MIVPKKIIISRTDSIGDVILTLPLAGVLKEMVPGVEVVFLGRSYTKPIIDACSNVDEFLNWDDVSKLTLMEQKKVFAATKADCIVHVFPNKDIARVASAANVAIRIGTTNRLFHWTTCNKLVRLSRKNSDLHEAQLNLKLIEPIVGKREFSLDALPSYYGLTNVTSLPLHLQSLLDPTRVNVILHTKSKGSAREWS
jgi:heptosyltransferase III